MYGNFFAPSSTLDGGTLEGSSLVGGTLDGGVRSTAVRSTAVLQCSTAVRSTRRCATSYQRRRQNACRDITDLIAQYTCTDAQTAHRKRRAELGEPAESQESKVAKLPSGAARGAVDDLVLSENEEYSLDEPSADSADRMSKNEATESQRQSEAIRGNQRQSVACHTEAIRDHQIQSGHTSGAIRCNRTPIRRQSDAIRRNQHWQSGDIQGHSDAISMPGALCFPCFCVLGRHIGPVFCVFVFWQPPLKTQRGSNKCSVAADSPRAGASAKGTCA